MLVKEKKIFCDSFFKILLQEIETMTDDWTADHTSPPAFHITEAFYPDKDYYTCIRFRVKELEGWLGSCEISSIKKTSGKKEYEIIANYYFQYEELADKIRYSHSYFKGYFKFRFLYNDETQCYYYAFEEYPELPYQNLNKMHFAMEKIRDNKWIAIYRDWTQNDLEGITEKKAKKEIVKSLRYSRREDYYSQKYSYAFAKKVAKLTADWEGIPESDVYINDEGENCSPRYEIMVFVDEKDCPYEAEGCYSVSDEEAKIIGRIQKFYHFLMKIRGLHSLHIDSFYHYMAYFKKNKQARLSKLKKWKEDEEKLFGKKNINFREKVLDNMKEL